MMLQYSSIAQRRLRRLNAPHLLAKVHQGVTYVDGIRTLSQRKGRVAA